MVLLRLFLISFVVLGLTGQAAHLIATGQGPSPAPRKPNVVLIIMDDMGYGDIGSYGVTDIRTPNLDRLAQAGVRLIHAYANGAVCSPTRAAFVSGRYQQRVGIESALTELDVDQGLPVTGTSLPALLRKNGYVTGLIGKWHLGFKPEFRPNRQGFDEFFGFLAGALDYYTHRRGDGTLDLYENDKPVETPNYLTDEITRRAVDFIDRRSNGPFFLEVAYNAVHWPFQPPGLTPEEARKGPPHPERSGDVRLNQGPKDPNPPTRRDYARMLEQADLGIGAILGALDRHALSRETIVIFTNDNGGEWLSRNAPFSNGKGTVWEGGIRVPLILRWPGRLPEGKTSEQAAITMDLTASILAVTGSAVPPTHHLDGIDLFPILRGEAAAVDRELFWRVGQRIQSDRQQKAVRSGRWKLLMQGGNARLFDLVADPGEKQDLAAQHVELVEQLKALLAAWEKDVDQRPQPFA